MLIKIFAIQAAGLEPFPVANRQSYFLNGAKNLVCEKAEHPGHRQAPVSI